MSGWIKLHRQIRDHWLWSDSDKLKMWIDIILEVNHTPAKIVMGYNLVECDRGQTVRSLQGWAERWNISKDSARHFLMLLQKDNMIIMENMKFTTRITVCNYDLYNTPAHTDQTEAKRKPNGSQTEADPNKKNKECKEEKEEYIDARFLPAFERWIKYKSERRQQYKTHDSKRAAYNRLVKLSNNNPIIAMQIVEQSLASNWSGLFELKEFEKSTPILSITTHRGRDII